MRPRITQCQTAAVITGTTIQHGTIPRMIIGATLIPTVKVVLEINIAKAPLGLTLQPMTLTDLAGKYYIIEEYF